MDNNRRCHQMWCVRYLTADDQVVEGADTTPGDVDAAVDRQPRTQRQWPVERPELLFEIVASEGIYDSFA